MIVRARKKFLLIIQSTGEPDIWHETKTNLTANVSVEISGLYLTVKMISQFVSPSEKQRN